MTRFWAKLSKRVLNLNSKFELHTDEYSLWLETWKAAAGGVRGPVKILPIAYLRLPAVTDIAPSPLVIVNVLIQVVRSIKFTQRPQQNNNNNNSNDLSAANILEAVFEID